MWLWLVCAIHPHTTSSGGSTSKQHQHLRLVSNASRILTTAVDCMLTSPTHSHRWSFHRCCKKLQLRRRRHVTSPPSASLQALESHRAQHRVNAIPLLLSEYIQASAVDVRLAIWPAMVCSSGGLVQHRYSKQKQKENIFDSAEKNDNRGGRRTREKRVSPSSVSLSRSGASKNVC